MLAPLPNSPPLPLVADDLCEAAFGGADPTGPRKYYRARYYDPKIGRFISADPSGYAAGLNLYSYVGNSAPNFLDPRGRAKLPPTHHLLPPSPNANTVTCDGKGGFMIQTSPDIPPSKCVMDCILGHEGRHLIKVLQASPTICSGQPRGLAVATIDDLTRLGGEQDAYKWEDECLASCPCDVEAWQRRELIVRPMLRNIERLLQ